MEKSKHIADSEKKVRFAVAELESNAQNRILCLGGCIHRALNTSRNKKKTLDEVYKIAMELEYLLKNTYN